MSGASAVVFPERRPAAAVRLLCVPHAGAGSTAYHAWHAAFRPEIELAVLRLPGREGRFDEAVPGSMAGLIDGLVPEVLPALDRPYGLFGHCTGALVALELARRLERGGEPGPLVLAVSGAAGPRSDSPAEERVADLPDDRFVARLRELGGTDPAVLDDPEVLEMVLPAIRGDFRIVEAHHAEPEPRVGCPIIAFAGLHDALVPVSEVERWADATSRWSRLRMLDGDHFFLERHRARVAAEIERELLTAISEG